jgi:hypothetical protein
MLALILLCCTLLPSLLSSLDSFIYQTFIEWLGTRLDTRDTKLTKTQSCPWGLAVQGEKKMWADNHSAIRYVLMEGFYGLWVAANTSGGRNRRFHRCI